MTYGRGIERASATLNGSVAFAMSPAVLQLIGCGVLLYVLSTIQNPLPHDGMLLTALAIGLALQYAMLILVYTAVSTIGLVIGSKVLVFDILIFDEAFINRVLSPPYHPPRTFPA